MTSTADVTRTDLELSDDWAYGAGILHGGWLLETMTGIALERTAHPHVLAVSAHYAAAPKVGASTIEVEALREGRSVASLRARLVQEGRVKVEALLTAGTLPGPDVPPFRVDAAPPDLPPVEECVAHVQPEGGPRNGIAENLDVRMDPATAGFLRGEPGGGNEVRGWMRARSGREPDPLLLLAVADGMPPVTLEMGVPGWVPTIELTVYLRAVPAPGWLRVVQRSRVMHGGWLDEECLVWDSTGRLVAQATQLAGFREPSA